MQPETNHQSIPFDNNILEHGVLSKSHRTVLTEILRQLELCRRETYSASVILDEHNGHVVRVVPKEEKCCRFSIHLYPLTSAESGFGTIGIEAGEGAFINIPEDIPPYPAPTEEIPEIVSGAVEAILRGHLTEEIYEAVGQKYRCVFDLPTHNRLLGIDRRDFWKSLCAVFRRKSKRITKYLPFEQGEEEEKVSGRF